MKALTWAGLPGEGIILLAMLMLSLWLAAREGKGSASAILTGFATCMGVVPAWAG